MQSFIANPYQNYLLSALISDFENSESLIETLRSHDDAHQSTRLLQTLKGILASNPSAESAAIVNTAISTLEGE